MLKSTLLLVLFTFCILLSESKFTVKERQQGYAHHNDTTYFIFDPDIYDAEVGFVIVEGAMRGWDHSLNDRNWQLQFNQNSDLWILAVNNPGFKNVTPLSEFKFRINQGDWLVPPSNAPNVSNGNLLFLHDYKPLRIEAEIVSQEDIRLIFPAVQPEYSYDPKHYLITNAYGKQIAVKRIIYIEPGVLQIIPSKPLNPRRLYHIEIKYLGKNRPIRYDGWFRHLYSDKKLGANYNFKTDTTHIRLFAPRADLIKIYLYKKINTKPNYTLKMNRDSHGIWEIALSGNWEGWYYDFSAHGPDEPGNKFFDINPVHFSDPWGRVSIDTFGPCRIWPKTKPATPLASGIPPLEDVIAYEVHIQDFTRNLPLPDSFIGTFKGFARPGLKNAQGETIGLDHLVELGINVAHLMPVQEYLHFPDEEWQDAFKNDSYMIEQGVNLENYQWGYRTSHAFALESRYRVKGSTWGAQNNQFRDLVQAFHDRGIAVIVDVVFNHTAERMDDRQYYFNFSAIDIPYFYRTNDDMDYIGEYGTETKSEERPMMQRWIIEQCTDLIAQYGIDGFRIDIAGQTDEQTLKALREALGPDKIVYGEPWIASADPDYENNPDWDWYKIDAPLTFFQDDSRNAFKGPTSNPENKKTDRGYAGGNGERDRAKLGLSAGFPEDETPLSGINYLDIHDNWALADRFAKENWDGRYGVDENAYKIAATLLFTSLGPIILHGGTELMRSKGIAPLKEIVKHTQSGPIYIHGKRDSYNLAKANSFLWHQKGLNIGEASEIYCNYRSMFEFWKGMIAFRKSSYGKIFRINKKPDADYYQWIEPENSMLLGYIVDEKVCALLNTDNRPGTFSELVIPDGKWRLIATEQQVDHANGVNVTDKKRPKYDSAQLRDNITLPAQSLRIWIKIL